MKKFIVFISLIAVLMILLAVTTKVQNAQLIQNNPFEKEDLNPATIEQLSDPLYKNIILPNELENKLQNKEEVFVYFYSPKCEYCKQTSPIVVPLAEKLDIDLYLFNILEFNESWKQYSIEGTPTLIHFENGAESERIEGLANKQKYEDWFK